jgi:hypothetical protein
MNAKMQEFAFSPSAENTVKGRSKEGEKGGDKHHWDREMDGRIRD